MPRPPLPRATHSSVGGLVPEEVAVVAVEGRVDLGVEEEAAVADGLEGGGALVGEAQAHKDPRLLEQGLQCGGLQHTVVMDKARYLDTLLPLDILARLPRGPHSGMHVRQTADEVDIAPAILSGRGRGVAGGEVEC